MTDQTVIAQPAAPAPSNLPDIPGYQVERLLGKGGMAEVFLAEDSNLGRKAAIKMINLEGSMDADFRQRFEDEAKTVAAFNHPNIVTVYGFGEVEGKQFIAMSFESGGELDDRLHDQSISQQEALQITAKLAAALAYSHQRGIVHRDIKPANVLFDESGSPVLSDFGIAKALDLNSGLTQTGMAIGSPAYMSPEQLMGQKVDGKSDVYSLGLVLFQMLHGQLPPKALKLSQDADEKRKIIDDALGPEAASISDILEACFEFAPENRPTAGELAAKLQAIEKPEKSSSKLVPIVLGGALLAGIVGMGAVLLPPKSAEVDVKINPQDAALLIDGEATTATKLSLSPGSHQALLLAPGYQGVSQTFSVSTSSANSLNLALQPLEMPNDANTQTAGFHFQMSEKVPADAIDYSDISFPIFLDLLRLKESSFEKSADEKQALAEAFRSRRLPLAEQGDALSQIALLLADSDDYAALDGPKRQRYKSELGAGDYPLGAFYAGFLLRTEAQENNRLDLDKVKKYHGFLKKAQNVGFTLADSFIKEAEDVMTANGDVF